MVTSFVFSSFDARESFLLSRKTKDDPRNHTNQHELKHSNLELDPTFEAKPLKFELLQDRVRSGTTFSIRFAALLGWT